MNIKKKLSLKGKITVLVLFFVSLGTVFHLASPPSKARVNLKILSSSQEIFQLFWHGEDDAYSQEKSSLTHLKPGRHEYYLTAGSSPTITKLRLDPAVRQSTMAIEQLILELDGELVFRLDSEDLYNALLPVQDVVFEFDQQNGQVLVVSTGIDPIIELDITDLTKRFELVNSVKQAGQALLFTMVFMIPLLYITSERYVEDSYSSYPARKKHWIYWGVVFLILGMYLTIVTPVHLINSSPVLYFAAISYVTGALLFIPVFWFATRKPGYTTSGKTSRFTWFWFALPSFVVWMFYLLSFWPGSMSPDSLDQWKQVLDIDGHLRDWHPAFHTITIWLITRIKLSPATVVIVQILALGSTAGWALSVFQRYGVPKPVLWITCLLFALLPINGLMVVTLWKDVAYSIVLLVLAIFIFQIVMQKGLWLDYPRNFLLLGGILALVSLYRHNGIIPACVVGILLLGCYRKYWREVIFAIIVAVLIHAGVRGPLYNFLEVKRGNPITKVQQKLKIDFFSKFVDKPSMTQNFQVSEKAAYWKWKKGKKEKDEEKTYSGKVWDRVFSASILWRIKTMDFFHKRIEYVNLWHKKKDRHIDVKYVSSNKLGIDEDSVIPAGMGLLYAVFNESRHNQYMFWMWRPAVFLYVLTGLLIILSWRFRKKLYLVLVPSLANSLPVFLVVIHKSVFRYHYPLVVLGVLFIVPLLFLKPIQSEE